jgi:hypothetical protein
MSPRRAVSATVADLLTYMAAGVALFAAIGRFRSIRPAALTPAQRHLLVALIAIAPSLIFVAPMTQAATAPIDPFPYATQLASSALAMLASYCVVAMLAHVVADPRPAARRARGHLAWLAAAIAIMTALLVAADVEFAGDFTMAAAHDRLLAAHQVVYFCYLGSRTGRFIGLMRRYVARPDTRPLMRRGMFIVLLAAIAGQLWLLWSVLTMVMIHTGQPLVRDPTITGHVLGATAATLMALGSTLPAWGGWLHRTIHRARVHRALRDITPLWRLLATALPEITLPQPALNNPELLLYRRIIEIRDAQRRLLGYVPLGIDEQILLANAREHRLDMIAIRMEAAALAAAIEAYRAGRRQPHEPTWIHYPETTQPTRLAEAQWLIRVHAAMRHNATVARVVQWARPRLNGTRSVQQT